jgi:hypothetical protein
MEKVRNTESVSKMETLRREELKVRADLNLFQFCMGALRFAQGLSFFKGEKST